MPCALSLQLLETSKADGSAAGPRIEVPILLRGSCEAQLSRTIRLVHHENKNEAHNSVRRTASIYEEACLDRLVDARPIDSRRRRIFIRRRHGDQEETWMNLLVLSVNLSLYPIRALSEPCLLTSARDSFGGRMLWLRM